MVRHPPYHGRGAVAQLGWVFTTDNATGTDHGGAQGGKEPCAEGLRCRAAPADRRRDHAACDRVHGAPGAGEPALLRLCRSHAAAFADAAQSRIRGQDGERRLGGHAGRDDNVGQLLDGVERLGMRDDTIVIFTSDNGPEFVKPWDGWAGPWRGQYFTAWEGGIRVPFMIRWPGKIPAARLSDEIVHGVNLFPTLASFVGATVPDDRPIDGVDQSPFFLG